MQLPRTLDEAADFIIAALDDESRQALLSVSRTELIRHHHGWGTGIRNDLGLWGSNPELLADCGSPKMLPDDASMVIMYAVWNKLRGLPVDDARKAPERLLEDQLREFGADMVYRMNRNSGENEQNIYRTLKHLFGMSYRQFKDLIARVDAQDAARRNDGGARE